MLNYHQARDAAYPYNYILDAIGLSLAIPGFIISSLVFRILLNRKWSHMNVDLKLILLTLIFDMISCIEAGLNCFFNLINMPYNLSQQWSCNLAATICLLGFITSINLVGLIAFERCLLIVYHRSIKEVYYWLILGVFIAINVASILVGWLQDGFTIMPATMYCIFNVKTTGGKVSAVITLLSALISVTVVFAGYIQIALKRARESRQTQIELGLDPDIVNKSIKSTIAKSMIIVLVSCLNNGPYCILVIISLADNSFLTPLIDCISSSCLMLNLCLNTIIVLHMRPGLLKEVLNYLGYKNYLSFNSRMDEDDSQSKITLNRMMA